MKKIIYAIIIGTFLTACSTLEEDVARFETYNCYELGKEIGRYEYMLSNAKTDETVAVLEQIFGDKKEREEAETDEIIAEWDKGEARDYLRELERIRYQKGCR
ncbi:MAG: hypothetical protein L3J05_00490 [Robiginitomaculum sp.]|nr:hypothetical protein [Robiginitomaculum sp.]